MSKGSEEDLIAEAVGILGDSEPVLAAGHFGLANLVVAQMAGLSGAGMATSLLDASPITDGVIGGLGAFAATKAAAEAQGVTMKLLVAVTADNIHVLNRDTGGRLTSQVTSFPRAEVDIEISKMGLSRFLELTDRTTGNKIKLHGSVSRISAQSKGDKVVLDLLAA